MLEGLLDIIKRSNFHGRNGRFYRSVGCYYDDNSIGVYFFKVFQNLYPVHARH